MDDTDRERRHVMFVDDEPATHRLVERSLRGEGVRLTCVEDGAQALQVLERARVDLLITGLTMPVVDGVELLRHVANRRLAIPVIVATGAAAPSPSRLAFLREPVEPAALLALVRERLDPTFSAGPLTVAELAQILTLVRRSCVLRAHADGTVGQLLFAAGVLVDASVGPLRGDAAAREVLAWPRALLRVDSLPRSRGNTVVAPLATLLPGERAAVPEDSRAAQPSPVLMHSQALSPVPEDGLTPVPDVPAPVPEASPAPVPEDSPAPVPEDSPPLSPVPEDSLPPLALASALAVAAGPPTVPAWEQPGAQVVIAGLLTAALMIDGALGAALAVWELDHCLGVRAGPGPLGLAGMQAALAGNCRVMRAMMSSMTRLGLRPEIHDVLITLDDQLHVLAPLPRHDGLFLYLVLDKARSNLALARHRAQRLVAACDLATEAKPAPTPGDQ